MFEEFSVGQTVIITTIDKSIMGEIRLIGKNGKRIKLANTTDLKNERVYDGEINIFCSDIRSIHHAETNDKTEDSKSTEKSTNNAETEKEIKQIKEFSIDLQNKIDFMLSRIIYIKETDKLYHDAIKDLSKQSKVSLSIESCSTGRNSLSATLITFFSLGSKNLYVFDMQYLRNLYPEFKKIFIESPPIKIVFDGRYINDYLHDKYKVELKGISDTFVGHLLLTKENEEIGLMECLTKYLNIPKNYFVDDETINWNERPLKPELITLTAKKAVLNFLLNQIILEEGLLGKYYDTCQGFSKLYSSNNDFVEVAKNMSIGDTDSLEEIINTDVELSYDLKDLTIGKAKK